MKDSASLFKLWLPVVCLLLHFGTVTAGDVEIHPLPSSYESSGYWQVSVNGMSVPVAKFDPQGSNSYYFAHISASGANTFEVEAYQAITDYSIRPSS
ncbi:MAG: hypothetical protein WA913_14630, partial [Pricia sp.]